MAKRKIAVQAGRQSCAGPTVGFAQAVPLRQEVRQLILTDASPSCHPDCEI
jgi:hypothetical protein